MNNDPFNTHEMDQMMAAVRTMATHAARYFAELKEQGLPDDVCVKLTGEYMRVMLDHATQQQQKET